MQDLLKKLFRGEVLSRAEAKSAMGYMMDGSAQPEEIAAFLGSISARGETVQEIVGCVEAMREKSLKFETKRTDLIDVCGTGGDDLNTFNISTTNALLLSSLGLGVVKHGNRAVSSRSGSADVLEKLGIPTGLKSTEEFEKSGFVFLFAPHHHPAMKNVAPVRKTLGLRTIFNMLGPLSNPAPVRRQVVGVYSSRLVPLMAEALKTLGVDDALVVYGEDGLDEISLSTWTQCARVRQGRVEHLIISAHDFGVPSERVKTLLGGSSEENAKITEAILSGEPGPKRDIVLMNAAAALVVAGQANTWKEGVELARSAIDSGRARQKLDELRRTPS